MTIDFILINDKQVGSYIQEIEVPIKGLCKIEVPFREFIIPYLEKNRTYEEVHNRLWLDFVDNLEEQGDAYKKGLSELLQARGMLMESLKLIEQNYYQFL
ncbi:MAG: hypothetical protein IIA85_02615 [Nanoarchaeota archaeon]|nr:hypothetical protein [Nanoarchaeota archaeon]